MKKISFCLSICLLFLLFSCDPTTPHTHKWNSGTITKAATCSSVGEKTFKCECGATKTEEVAIDPDNHDYVYATFKEATFLEAGTEKGTCSRCKKETERPTEVKSLVGTLWKCSLVEAIMEAYLSFDSSASLSLVTTGNVLGGSEKTYLYQHEMETSYEKKENAIQFTMDNIPATVLIKANEEGVNYLYLTADTEMGSASMTLYITEEGIPEHNFTEPFDVGDSEGHALLCSDTHDHGEDIDGYFLDVRIPHTVISWEEESPSTCINHGQEKGACSLCNGTVWRDLPLAEHTYNRVTVTEATFLDKGTYKDICTYCSDEIKGEYYKELKGSNLKISSTYYWKEGDKFVTDSNHVMNGYALFLENGKAIISFHTENEQEEDMLGGMEFDGFELDRENMRLILKKGDVSQDTSIEKTENGFKFSVEEGNSKSVTEFKYASGISVTYKDQGENHWLYVKDGVTEYPLYIQSLQTNKYSKYLQDHEYADGDCKLCGHTQD